jgi:uroporphyrinogen decarboxylase
MRRALWRQPLDHLPVQTNYTADMGARLAGHLGVAPQALPDRLGNHLLRVDLSYQKRRSADGKVEYDWWGAGWNTETEGYWLADAPLAQTQDLDAIAWPDPADPTLLAGAAQAIAADGGRHFVAPNFGFCLYERAWSLRGYEQLNMDLALDPEWVAELLERITAIQVALAGRFVALGVDGGYAGDDYGAQKGMLFSPRTWRALVKPRLARIFAVFRHAGLPVILHSDGDIREILPDLVEIGLTALNPAQPEVLEHGWLRAAFGERLAFYGGVSTQAALPYGTPAEVRAAVLACARDLAPDGTGLVIGPSHRMTSEIPMANVDAMLAAFANLGGAA